MKKYCLLQLKRAARFLPWGLCVALVLFGCMSLVFTAMMTADGGEEDAKIQVAMVGTANDTYLQWGLAAMKFDSTAMSIKLVTMEEPEAMAALERGDIAAYIVFPESFVNDALMGDVGQLRLVSTAGSTGLISILKEEITALVDKILVSCENGSYGAGDAMADNGYGHTYYDHVNGLALEYVELLFDRSRMYRVEGLIQDSAPFDRYMLGGLSVLMLFLCCLPFAPLYIRDEQTLCRVLRSRRVGPVKQTLAEFAAYVAALLMLLAFIAPVLRFSGLLPEETGGLSLFVCALPTLLMAAALTYCLYILSDHLIGGVLLTFFAVIVLGFAGGCMYPIQVFPAAMQRLAAVLPSGIARRSLTACFMGESPSGILALLGFSAACLAIAMAVRSYKMGKVRR